MDAYQGDFHTNAVDFFYDYYFKGEAGHEDWTDEQIQMSVNQDDIETCLKKMSDALYKHFGVKKKENEKC